MLCCVLGRAQDKAARRDKGKKNYPFHMNMKRLTLFSAFEDPARPIFPPTETDKCSIFISGKAKNSLWRTCRADYPFQLLPFFSGMFFRNGYGEGRGGVGGCA